MKKVIVKHNMLKRMKGYALLASSSLKSTNGIRNGPILPNDMQNETPIVLFNVPKDSTDKGIIIPSRHFIVNLAKNITKSEN